MIKFTTLRKNKLLIGLGITEGNVAKLKKGQPIIVDCAELGIAEPIEFLIFYGETNMEITNQLRHLIGPETVTNIENFMKKEG